MKKQLSLLVDSHHGIYCAQVLVDSYGQYLDIPQEDKDILKAGPDHEHYLDTWADIEDSKLTDETGEKYFIWSNDGDIWAVPDGWEWSEDEDTYIEPMAKERVIYENKTFEILSVFTYYILRAKDGFSEDQYFNTSTAAKKAIGLPHDAKSVI